MAESKEDTGEKLYTLSEVAEHTGISMPTLQRYKKNYQNRIPSEGKGRRQRYPREAFAVFEEIKEENISRRGRPRKSRQDGGEGEAGTGRRGRRRRGGKGAERKPSRRRGRARTAAPAAAGEGRELLTLTEIGNRTGISYPTLTRYVKMHGDEIPHEGEGRRRRYYPEAVEVFQRLRQQSRRGPKRGAAKQKAAPARGRRRAAGAEVANADLMERLKALEKQVKHLEKLLSKPIKVTIQPRG